MHGELIQPSDWKFYHTRFKKENRKKKITFFVNLKGTLIWGLGVMLVMFAHLSFPLEIGSLI